MTSSVIPLLAPTVKPYGPGLATHDMPCSICTEATAVLFTNDGTFHPCRSCQEKGWTTVRAKSRLQRWVLQTFFDPI